MRSGRWGNRWAPNEDGPALLLRHLDCGHVIEPVLDCGESVHASSLETLPGPATIARAASASGL